MRRLIVNADDFGRSHSINEAVRQAHQQGILTTASLMVNGEAREEAVQLARQNPRLGVGLHLSLACGKSTLPPTEIPGLVDVHGNFSNDPIKTGFKYFANRCCRSQLEKEIAAQFERFRQTGLPLDHVNGHLHFHLHPTIFNIISRHAFRWNVRHLRLTRDPFLLNARLAKGHWFYRLSHAIIFSILARHAANNCGGWNFRSPRHVFGLLQHARVDEDFILRLLPKLPVGDSELYSHPSVDATRHELNALISPKVKKTIENCGIKIIHYADL